MYIAVPLKIRKGSRLLSTLENDLECWVCIGKKNHKLIRNLYTKLKYGVGKMTKE
jgi:hypothetical protein